MWKREFACTENGLNPYILHSKNPACIVNDICVASKLPKLPKLQHRFIPPSSDDEEDHFDWDATIAPTKDWNSYKIQEFLRRRPSNLPTLQSIVEVKTNPYGGNPLCLCEFSTSDGSVILWVSSTILYHTKVYQKKLKNALKTCNLKL